MPVNNGTIEQYVKAPDPDRGGTYVRVFYQGDPEGVAYDPANQPLVERTVPLMDANMQPTATTATGALVAQNTSQRTMHVVISDGTGAQVTAVDMAPGQVFTRTLQQMRALGLRVRLDCQFSLNNG
jgi:hypothetical protein